MSIATGFQKIKDYIKRSTGDYILTSRWANANTIECDDGKTIQNKIGGISGISSSLTANSTTQAASTNLTNQLYQNITSLISDLTWKDGGLAWGSSKLTLPTSFRELWITIEPGYPSDARFTFHIIKEGLAGEYRRFRSGYITDSEDLWGISIMASETEAYIEKVIAVGVEYTGSAVMHLFYR